MDMDISIVTICYNCLSDLKKTVTSVEAVKGAGVEFIVVDGGSTDGSSLFLDGCTLIDKYISEPDSGIYDAMNKGVRLSNGRFVIFLNAGDIFDKGFNFAKLRAEFYKDENSILCGNAVRKLSDGRMEKYRRLKIEKIFEEMPFCHQAVFVRRSLLVKSQFDIGLRIAGDYAFFLGCYIEGVQFKYISDSVAVVDNEGISNTKKIKSTLERYRVYRDVVGGVGAVDFAYAKLLFRSILSDFLSIFK